MSDEPRRGQNQQNCKVTEKLTGCNAFDSRCEISSLVERILRLDRSKIVSINRDVAFIIQYSCETDFLGSKAQNSSLFRGSFMAYDEFEEAPVPVGRGASLPGIVKAAAIIWILFGCLGILGNIINIVTSAGNAANQPGGIGAALAGPMCGIVVSGVFLMAGINTLKGNARDTLGNGIGSIFFAFLQFGLAALMFLGAAFADKAIEEMKKDPNNPQITKEQIQTAATITGGILVGMSGLLGLAGVLALAGRASYLDYREAGGFATSRRPSLRREEPEDDLDRPRRPDVE